MIDICAEKFKPKLTAEQVSSIRASLASGKYLQREIAAFYGVTQAMVSLIKHRKNWKDGAP